MSNPIAKHADGSNCYTKNCSRGGGHTPILSAKTLNERLASVDVKSTPLADEILDYKTLEMLLKYRDNVKKNKDLYQKKANWQTLQKALRLLNPQSYGAQFEKRIIAAYGWKKNKSQERIGDAQYILDGKIINSEIKVSVINEADRTANIVQIRPDHLMDCYDVFIIGDNGEVERFRLQKKDMENELNLTGWRLAHGTKGNKDGDADNAEYRIDFKASPENPIYNRWKKQYFLIDGDKELITYTP